VTVICVHGGQRCLGARSSLRDSGVGLLLTVASERPNKFNGFGPRGCGAVGLCRREVRDGGSSHRGGGARPSDVAGNEQGDDNSCDYLRRLLLGE